MSVCSKKSTSIKPENNSDYTPPKMKSAIGESPIEWLSKRKTADGRPYIDKQELNAAMQLYADFERGQMQVSFGQNWDRFLDNVYSSTPSKIEDARAYSIDKTTSAKKRFSDAITYLGYGLGNAVVRTVCQRHTLETLEKEMQWPARSGKAILKIALYQLSVFYGMRKNDRNIGKIKVWRGY